MNDFKNIPVTAIIILLNCLVFLVINAKNISVEKLGSSYISTLQDKQYYRVISSAFTHREVPHLLMNMYSLYNIGSVIEKMLGTGLYIIAYIVIMIVGGLLSARIHKIKTPFTLSIGASGVICGLLGIYMAVAFMAIGFAAIRSVLPTIVLLLLMTASKRIDSIGHFTGLLMGIALGFGIVFFYRM
ncbi:MAG: rhomboid family intramembrane serine protease [Butyrivibrio sp.]|nr:rhomboid family intramembrane serine protease [Butyrivibrio sp.]